MPIPEIKIEKALTSTIDTVDFKNLIFGRHFTDHMYVADYADGEWGDLRIIPFQDITLHPATSAMLWTGLQREVIFIT